MEVQEAYCQMATFQRVVDEIVGCLGFEADSFIYDAGNLKIYLVDKSGVNGRLPIVFTGDDTLRNVAGTIVAELLKRGVKWKPVYRVPEAQRALNEPLLLTKLKTRFENICCSFGMGTYYLRAGSGCLECAEGDTVLFEIGLDVEDVVCCALKKLAAYRMQPVG